ncbi:UDP-N-acetylglucosamine 2-epimerase (non-hydrolyzing) [Peribacillus simplex]|uniref:non-hydrolyzing UDP-N-acetylglucosamine 2-epimerase n=1 Tax=Peribacillus TaxID=2675229 RepID=UPI000B713D2F|nr:MULTISPECIES: UDP-N-acetylglucosamine 2-epimerase (non-hydrolyzing) [Peribacillus]MDF9759252.1 UDP-N-acetylglucosamine 2-epimerase (non-hydrolyzing) [Peribacillus simplex]MDV7766247.1 UDP-N-acetylglucosamine 2-epimerase (non-hydrolyzing) [Peribacillus sp. CSMR9]MDW7616613.1 UDP-N-acetylglucosamine 2-epimerase (non-hydrolyzing) [Peribacillus simplex]SNT07466.1 UDP-N-Acetylglucosamine 2-epimerase [Bacillus sp. OK838]
MPKNRLKVMTVFGTRPEAIKMAPVVLELKKHQEEIETIVVVTAQHRDMLDQVLQCFKIRPDYDLNMMKERQTLEEITTRGIGELSALMKELQPDIVLVHGDTTTTFIASLAAFYNKIQIGHVEAGLRTGNKYSPYPEEMNRQLTGVLADLHFAPTNQAAENLILENKKSDSIHITGNTAIDALKTTVRKDYEHPILSGLNGDRMLLMTAHRRENIGKPMEEIFRSVKRLLEDHTDIQVVFPLHKNPVVREIAYRIFGETERLHLIEPLEVLDFHNFAAHAHLIMTDSGGVQEEAPSLGVPVLVLRDTTERPEGIEAGTLLLAGIEEERIYQLATDLLTNEETYKKMATASNPYGDGFASKRIVEILLKHCELQSPLPL